MQSREEKLKAKAYRLLKTAPIHWRDKVEKMSAADRREVGKNLDWLVQQASQLSAYCDALDWQTHGQAVRVSMRQRVRIRRALGYALPKAGVFPF